MFAKTIIDSDAFLDMPLSSQALYFHLAMRADDDGFVNSPKKISRALGVSDDDIKILLAKKFVLSFDSGVIVIKHWRIHNYIQKDRYKTTVYHDEMSQLAIHQNNGYTMDTQCIHNVDTGKVRLEIGKDNKVKREITAKKTSDEKILEEFISKETIVTDTTVDIAQRFIAHRRSIKDPVKTDKSVKMFINAIRDIVKSGYNLEEVMDLVESREWKNIKLEWVQKELGVKMEWER